MNIGIIANCQVQPIAKALEALPGVGTVIALPIHLYGTAHFKKLEDSFQKLVGSPDSIILSHPVGDRFAEYETLALKQRTRNVQTITNIHFSGLHPDTTYLGDQGGRIQSPVGDYHSKIVIHSYLTGQSRKECLARFNENEFEKRGYYEEFSLAASRLLERDTGIDIKFGDRFLQLTRQRPVLYTLNHPTAFVFQELACLLAERLGLGALRMPVEYLPNYLANNTWWPVYQPIAEHHGLKYDTPMFFKQPDQMGGKLLALEPFVNACYDNYEKQANRIMNARQAKALITNWDNSDKARA